MSGQNYAAQVNDSVNQALALGLNATPSVLVNGMTDLYDYEALQQARSTNCRRCRLNRRNLYSLTEDYPSAHSD